MKIKTDEFASSEVRRTARRMAKVVRQARLARRMPQTELAARARTSPQTVMRIEAGSSAASLGAWLSVMEQLGLLKLLSDLRDSASEELLSQHKTRRARLNTPDKDMNF
ncbi:MAG: helix-turn-helix protein [Alphaproteobacteria bacterium ADurb.BinA280]|jgi:ribosome-binding protein aMBF1 (putative translation factor)|nr:helix-turn-helix transcriptional regulator [Xanthomonadales bacterium]MCC6505696.1 helix-turn-helix transcriptional regulator [Aquimonas sp.]OPZ13362.1 MAG: helix-turn-helix protein [Alphaproteobacteria bacterium ADurb.BinA280]